LFHHTGVQKDALRRFDGIGDLEDGAVGGFRKVCDFFIGKFFSRKGETIEETRERLRRK
jgi:hypothetical protein